MTSKPEYTVLVKSELQTDRRDLSFFFFFFFFQESFEC